MRSQFLAVPFLLATLCGMPRVAHAAQSYDNCTGFIDTVPAVIATQGTWCLRRDLASNIPYGSAITINANNITIDCNDFKLGGLVVGPSSQAIGIAANERQNVTIRHCGIRGFDQGIYIFGGGGHLVEDNRLDNNLYAGIFLSGSNSLVRRNRVYDTGGRTSGTDSIGINTSADVVDNIVDGVFTDGVTAAVLGIYAGGLGTWISGNRVGGLALKDGGVARGINAQGLSQTVTGNRVVAQAMPSNGYGISGNGDSETFCAGNTVANFTTAYIQCDLLGNSNDSL